MRLFCLCIFMIFFSACSFKSELIKPKADFRSDRSIIKISKNWWQDFNDPLLNSLINQGFENNSDLKLAFIRYKKAIEMLVIDSSSLFPKLDLAGGAKRSKISSSFTNSFNLGLNLNYEFDIWARNLNKKRAGLAAYEANAFELENYRLLLSTSISKLYFNSIKLAREQAILEESQKAYENTYKIKQEQYRLGSIGEYELYQNKALLDGVKIRLENTILAKDANANALFTMTSSRLNDILYKQIDQKELSTYDISLPEGVSSAILSARADVRAALKRLEQANYLRGSARANYLPNISLSALLGYNSNTSSSLISTTNQGLNAGASFLMPLLHFGEINAGVNLAKLAEQEAFINYEKIIKNALSEVRTALRSKKNAKTNNINYANLYEAKARVYELLQDQYNSGSASLIDLLNAKNDLLNARINLSNSKLDLNLANLELIKAFGGGFNEKNSEKTILKIQKKLDKNFDF